MQHSGPSVCHMEGIQSRVSFAQFRSENGQAIPPEENFGQAIPPEPEKIARYLVLSTQKKAKNRGSKKFYPLNPVFWTIHEGCLENFF